MKEGGGGQSLRRRSGDAPRISRARAGLQPRVSVQAKSVGSLAGPERGPGGEEWEGGAEPAPGGWQRPGASRDPRVTLWVFPERLSVVSSLLVVEQLWNPDCESAFIRLVRECLEAEPSFPRALSAQSMRESCGFSENMN